MIPVQRTSVVILALVAAGCGGTTDHEPLGAATVAAPGSSQVSPAQATTTSTSLSTTHAAPPAARVAAKVEQAEPLPLRDWLALLGRTHRVDVRMDPSIATRPVATALPTTLSADHIASALAEFDLLLGYTRRGPDGAGLASVQVMPRGGIAGRQAAAPGARAAAMPAVESDPVLALQQIQQELSSGDAAVRGAALARSFDLEAPLPASTLLAALHSDAAGEVRLYALMALARHPAVDANELRALAEAAAFDADPAVRAHAAEVTERIGSLGRID